MGTMSAFKGKKMSPVTDMVRLEHCRGATG